MARGLSVAAVAGVIAAAPGQANAGCRSENVNASLTAAQTMITSVVLDCRAAGDDWRLEACKGLADRLRERLPGASILLSDAGTGADGAGLRISVEWLRFQPQFVIARLKRRGDGGVRAGPAMEFAVMDRDIGMQDARRFGRILADSLTLEK